MKLILLSPDWDSAANDLNKAAVCFQVNLSFLQNQHLLIRWLAVGRNVKLPTSEHVKLMPTLAGLKPNAAFLHFIRCLRSLYHSAKQLEGALLVCREQGRLEEVVQIKYQKIRYCCRWRTLKAEVACYTDKLVAPSQLCRCWWMTFMSGWNITSIWPWEATSI